MASEAEKRDAIRSLRGSIVRAIYRATKAETNATLAFLHRVCKPESVVSQAPVSDAMVYLTTSGLVERRESRIDAGDENPLVTFALTAKGISLAERTIEDANVNMD